MIDPNCGKSIIVTLLELLDRHVTTVSVLESRVAILEDERRSAVEMTRTKERALLELLDDMTTRIEELERRIDVPKVSKMGQTEEDEKVGLEDKGVQTTNDEEEKPRKTEERVPPAVLSSKMGEKLAKLAAQTGIETVAAEPEERIEHIVFPTSPVEEQTNFLATTKQAEALPCSSVKASEKQWERHRSPQPYRIKRFSALDPANWNRRLQFFINQCTYKKTFGKEIMSEYKKVASSEGGAIELCTMFVLIVASGMMGRVRARACATLIQSIVCNAPRSYTHSEEFIMYGIQNSPVGFEPVLKATPREKENVVNVMCLVAEFQKHGLMKNRKMIDAVLCVLNFFDPKNCEFAKRILAKLYKIEEQRLWVVTTNYSEEDENIGKPVEFTSPEWISVRKRANDLFPLAVNRGDFGRSLKKAPIEVQTVVGWLHMKFPTCPMLENMLTRFLNSISHKDLKLNRYNELSMYMHTAVTLDERSLVSEKLVTSIVVRALISPPELTSLYVRLLAETGKNFMIPGMTRTDLQAEMSGFHTESIFVVIDALLVAASLWKSNGTQYSKYAKECPKNVCKKLSAFFKKISENGFYRVAWFLHCLRDQGKAQASQIKDLRKRLLIATITLRISNTKFRLMRKWLHELDKSGYVDFATIEALASPLEIEENFASSRDYRRCVGLSSCN